MRIKKTSETTPRTSQTVNQYSESTSDSYACDYINNISDYSTTEKRIGTWIDGKPLYRKVVNFGALPNGLEKTVNHNISNLGYVKSLVACPYNPTSKYRIVIPRDDTNLYCNDTKVGIFSSIDRTAFTTCYIVIEYTKTTD